MGLETLSRPPHTLNELQQHFVELYGPRNNVWLPGRNRRINMLTMAVNDFQHGQRQGFGHHESQHLAARIISRIFCVAHGINNVSVNDGMMLKYPLNGCAYCGNFPCNCQEKRFAAQLSNIDPISVQHSWSLRDYQEHLGRLYGPHNRQKGLEYNMNRLSAEIGELVTVEEGKVMMPGISRAEIEHEYRLELADCTARTIAVANMLDIDLQSAVVERYWPLCRTCLQNPCDCRQFNFDQVRDQSEILRYHR